MVTCVSFACGLNTLCGVGEWQAQLAAPVPVHVFGRRVQCVLATLVVSWQLLAAVVVRPGSSSHRCQLLIGQVGLTFDWGGLLQGPVAASSASDPIAVAL